jgi:hypothetical protein
MELDESILATPPAGISDVHKWDQGGDDISLTAYL